MRPSRIVVGEGSLRRPSARLRRAFPAMGVSALLAALLPMLGGCNIVGALGQALPLRGIDAAYKGLAGQKVAVLIYIDPATQLDFPKLRSHLALTIQDILEHAAKDKDTAETFQGTTFLNPRSVIRFQDEHPELEGLAQETASRLGVTRVIYVEVTSFDVHSPMSIDLLKGTLAGNLQVIEVAADPTRTTKPVYTEPGMRVVYPRNAPDGVAASETVTSATIEKNTIEMFAYAIATRFFKHPSEN